MKRSENSMKLYLPSLSVNESLARSAVAAFVAQLNPTIEEISDIKCAVSEAVTNSIVHGYTLISTILNFYERRQAYYHLGTQKGISR